MVWEAYREEFEKAAKEAGKSTAYCEKWLSYAENLYRQGMPIIYTPEHLSLLVGYNMEYLYAAANCAERFYRRFEIPKKSGGMRTIAEPLPSLKEIQRWILDNILQHMQVSPYAKAYIKGRSIKDNVRFHRRQKKVLTLDIKDFFPSLSSWRVYQKFLQIGYQENVAMLLTNICCLDRGLPQGAPTSALLSNILLLPFDSAAARFAGKKGIRYTRYADDMTFSGDFDETEIIAFVKKQLKRLGLKINSEKTRLQTQGERQEVTGIVVNKKVQLSKQKRKEIRKNMYYIQKYGLESHLAHIKEERKNYISHLLGEIGYALFINPKDTELRTYQAYLKSHIT